MVQHQHHDHVLVGIDVAYDSPRAARAEEVDGGCAEGIAGHGLSVRR